MDRRRTNRVRKGDLQFLGALLFFPFLLAYWAIKGFVVLFSGIIMLLIPKDKKQSMFTSPSNFQSNTHYTEQEDSLDSIDNMSGQDFEDYIIQLLRKEGFTSINGTSYSGDYGVDIVATKQDLKYAIQCKRFANKVSVGAIQEVTAGRKHYRCDKALVITNNYFTKNAIELANSNFVTLWDRDDLIRMIRNHILFPSTEKVQINHDEF